MADSSVALFQPALHGASGPYDELINLIPLVIGAVLLLYLYLQSRKRRPEDEKQKTDEKGGQGPDATE